MLQIVDHVVPLLFQLLKTVAKVRIVIKCACNMICATGMQVHRCDCTSKAAPWLRQDNDLLSILLASVNLEVHGALQEQQSRHSVSVSPFGVPAVTTYG